MKYIPPNRADLFGHFEENGLDAYLRENADHRSFAELGLACLEAYSVVHYAEFEHSKGTLDATGLEKCLIVAERSLAKVNSEFGEHLCYPEASLFDPCEVSINELYEVTQAPSRGSMHHLLIAAQSALHYIEKRRAPQSSSPDQDKPVKTQRFKQTIALA